MRLNRQRMSGKRAHCIAVTAISALFIRNADRISSYSFSLFCCDRKGGIDIAADSLLNLKKVSFSPKKVNSFDPENGPQ